MKTDVLRIKLPEIFSWPANMGYLNRTNNEVMYKMIGDKLRRAYKVDDQIYLVEISVDEDVQFFEVDILNNLPWTDQSKQLISDHIIEWFDLNTDLTAFYESAASDTILKDLTRSFYGLRLVGMPDFYEAITWGILGQQINLTYAYTLKRRFVETYGESIEYDGNIYWIYPTPARIAETSIDELLKLKMSQRKAEYLLDISMRIVSGQMSKEYYQEFPNAKTAEKEMTKIRGIGPWTANYVLMRCLRFRDAFPMADIGLLNGIKEIENLESKPDKNRLLELGDKWDEWSAYVTFYIWRKLY